MLVACCATAQLLLIAHSMTAWFGWLAEHAAVTMHRAADCLLTNPLSQLDPAISDRCVVVYGHIRSMKSPQDVTGQIDEQTKAVGQRTFTVDTTTQEHLGFNRAGVEQFDPDTGDRRRQLKQLECIVVAVVPHHDPIEGAVSEYVRLCCESARIVLDLEIALPRSLVRRGGPGHVTARWGHTGKLDDMVWAASFRPASDRRAPPTAERLALHDCAGGTSVDVRIADLDA